MVSVINIDENLRDADWPKRTEDVVADPLLVKFSVSAMIKAAVDAAVDELLTKYNPNHGPDGRFASGGGGSTGTKPTSDPRRFAPDKKPPKPRKAGGCTINYAPPGREASLAKLAELIGKKVPEKDIPKLVGALKGSNIQVEISHNSGWGDCVYINAEHDKYVMTRSVFREGSKPMIDNAYFSIDREHRGQGLGPKILLDEVTTAQSYGIDTIHCTAGKGGDLIGWHVWPKCGYDAPIDKIPQYTSRAVRLVREIREKFPDAKNISDLMRTKEGRDFWTENGVEMDMAFDTRPGSLSRQVLDAYVASKSKPHPKSFTGTKGLTPDDIERREEPDDMDMALLDSIWDKINKEKQ